VIPGRIVALGLAALLLAGAGISVAATRDPADDDARGPAVTRPEVTTTSTTSPETSITSPPTSTTGVVSPPTTTGRTTTTVVRRTTTTTAKPGATTTTATAADCTASQLEVAATTDKRTYAPTEQVRLESTLRNRSSTTCFYAGYTFQADFSDPAGHRILQVGVPAEGSARSALVPGAVLTGSVPWDQRTCQQAQPCPALSPGTYSATARWIFPGGPFEARVTFALS
jgi:hypothetical protein